MTKKNPNAYAETIPLWRTAASRGYLEITMASVGKAIHLRQRCYQYRKALRAIQAEFNEIPGYIPSTPYDHILIYRIENRLIFDSAKLESISITDAAGNPIELDPTPIELPEDFPL